MVRLRDSDFQQKPDVIRRGLLETLSVLTTKGLQLRLAAPQ